MGAVSYAVTQLCKSACRSNTMQLLLRPRSSRMLSMVFLLLI